MYKTLSQLWAEVLAGDHRAWVRLVERYTGLIITVARRVGLDIMDAEDCAQHTWIALYRNRRKIRDPEKLPSWLILTARRQATRIVKRENRYEDLPECAAAIQGGKSPDEELLELEFYDVLDRAISRLPANCNKLLTSLFLARQKKSYKELAGQLKISVNTMGPLRSRCLTKLSDILKKMGYLEN